MNNPFVTPSFARSYPNKTCQYNLTYITHSNEEFINDDWLGELCCFPNLVDPSFFLDDKLLYELVIENQFNLMMSYDLPYELEDGRSIICILAKTSIEDTSKTLSAMETMYQYIEFKTSSLAISDLVEMFPKLKNVNCDATATSDTLGRNKVGLRKQLENIQNEFKYINVFGKSDTYKKVRGIFGNTFSESQFQKLLTSLEENEDNPNPLGLYTNDLMCYIKKTEYFKNIRIHLIKEADLPKYGISLNTKENSPHRHKRFRYGIIFELVDSYKRIRECKPLVFDASEHILYTIFLQAVINRVKNKKDNNYKHFCIAKEVEYETDKPDNKAIKLPTGTYLNKKWELTKIKENWEYFRLVDKILFHHKDDYKFDDLTLETKLIPKVGSIYQYVYNSVNKGVANTINSLSIKTQKTTFKENIDPIHFIFGINNGKDIILDTKNIILDLSDEDKRELEIFFKNY